MAFCRRDKIPLLMMMKADWLFWVENGCGCGGGDYDERGDSAEGSLTYLGRKLIKQVLTNP